MLDKADLLDDLGLFHIADKIDKFVISNNFMITPRRKKNPLQEINTKLDNLSSNVNGLMGIDSGGADDGGPDKITVEPMKEQNIEKVKFEIN